MSWFKSNARMTAQSFLEELSKIRCEFAWRLEPDTATGSERREWTRFQIRAVSDRAGTEEVVFDPIGAVCFARTGKVCDAARWAEAAEAIDLGADEARRLADAANDRTWEESEGRRRPNTRLQALRVDLIRAVETPSHAINL
jgi:hypothetical protein